MGKTILAIFIAVVVAAAAGLGGYRMGDSAGFERANQVRQQFLSTRQGSQGGTGSLAGGTGGGSQSRGVGISGVIKSVDGDTLTVTLGQRDVEVTLSDKTQVQKAGSGSRDDLKTGEHVLVTPDGTGGSNSTSLTAATIILLAQ